MSIFDIIVLIVTHMHVFRILESAPSSTCPPHAEVFSTS